MTAASSMSAIRRRRPPHRGHVSTSNPNVRRIKSAQWWCRAAADAAAGAAGPWGTPTAAAGSDVGRGTAADRQAARGPQHPVVQNQVDARPRHEHRQPTQELDGVERDVRRPVGPRLPELQPHRALVSHAEPL
jgi:hypothetical protein